MKEQASRQANEPQGSLPKPKKIILDDIKVYSHRKHSSQQDFIHITSGTRSLRDLPNKMRKYVKSAADLWSQH